MISKSFIKIMAIFLALSPVYTPNHLFAFPNIINSLYKKQADNFVDKVLPTIIDKWSVAQLTKYSHPYLFKQTPREEIERLFFLFQSLGPLKRYLGSQGQIALSLSSTGAQIVTGNYNAKATFQNGSATINVEIVRENKKWYISSFVVDSDAFKKRNTTNSIPNDKKLDKSELKQKVKEILTQNTIQKRRNVELIFQLAKIYKDEGKTKKAIQLYEKGLQVDASDLNKQFEFAQLLLKNKRQDTAIPILQTIFEFSEDWNLCQHSASILKKLHADIPETISQKKVDYKKIKVLLVPIGKPHGKLMLELRTALQNELGIPVSIAEKTVQPGKFDILLSDKYITDTFKKITDSLTRLQFNEIKNKLNLNKDDLNSPLHQSRFIITYLDKLGAEGIASRQQFEHNISQLKGRGQYYVATLTKEIRQIFPFIQDGQIQSYIGITSEDIGCDDCNYMYGGTVGIYSAISYYRFTAKFNREADNRPRLLKRLLKQALSSVNFTFGIPRCNTPYCARAFPHNLQEHDAKSEHLCRICKARLETFKKNLISNTMASEYSKLGERYLKRKKWNRAIQAYQKAIANDHLLGQAYEGLGVAFANTNKFKDAIDAYQKAIAEYEKSEKINPGGVYENLGIAFQNTGQNDKAFSAYTKAEFLTSVSDYTNVFLGNRFLSEQKYQKALDEFLAARKQNPTNKEASFGIGIAYVQLKEHNRAIPYLKEAKSAYPDNGDIYSLLGACYDKNGKIQQAIDHYKKAIELDPSFVEAYTQLGRLYGKMGMLVKSIDTLKAALTLAPKNANIWNSIGYTYYLKKSYNKAIQQYDQAIQLEPKFALVHYNKALAHYALKEFNSAIKHFDTAKKLHYPCSPEFQAALAIHRTKN